MPRFRAGLNQYEDYLEDGWLYDQGERGALGRTIDAFLGFPTVTICQAYERMDGMDEGTFM